MMSTLLFNQVLDILMNTDEEINTTPGEGKTRAIICTSHLQNPFILHGLRKKKNQWEVASLAASTVA